MYNPNLYNGGAAVVNSQPATNFFLQSQARKRAKDEALDNYFQNFNKSINGAGMRTQDIEGGWMDKINGWRDFYSQNKQTIKDPKLDNGKSYNEYMSRYQDILNDTEKSKNRAASIAKVAPIFADPTKRHLLSANTISAVHNADKNIYDDTGNDINESDIMFNPKDFTLEDQAKLTDNMTKGKKMLEEKTIGVTNPKTFQRDITTKSYYNPEDLKNMGAQAASEYASNDSYHKKIDDLFESSYNHKTGQVEIPKEYNDIFKNIYGKEIHTPQELGAAYALANVQREVTKTESGEDRFAQQKSLEGIKQSGRIAMANYNQKLKKDFDAFKKTNNKKEQTGIINKIVDDQINNAVSDIESRKELGTRGYYTMLVPPTILAAFQGGAKDAPIRMGLSKDKKHVFPIYERLDQNGNVDGETIGDEIPMQQYKTILSDKFLSQKDFIPETESQLDDSGNEESTNEWDQYLVKP